MIRDKEVKSPFLNEKYIDPIIIKDPLYKVTHSPVYDIIYEQMEERLKNREDSRMRYSYNLESLK